MKMKKLLFLLVLGGMFIIGGKAEARPYSQMSCYELWYARNAIFAREGYCFTTRQAINTFGRRCYPPTAASTVGRPMRWTGSNIGSGAKAVAAATSRRLPHLRMQLWRRLCPGGGHQAQRIPGGANRPWDRLSPDRQPLPGRFGHPGAALH